jgi:hypothetical protein
MLETKRMVELKAKVIYLKLGDNILYCFILFHNHHLRLQSHNYKIVDIRKIKANYWTQTQYLNIIMVMLNSASDAFVKHAKKETKKQN